MSPSGTPTTGPPRELIDRVRAMLPDRELREVRMFGVLGLMVDESLAVAAHKNGSLLVHVDPAEDPALLELDGASRAEMGAGRSMGAGWIHVDGRAIEDDQALRDWVAAAVRRPR